MYSRKKKSWILEFLTKRFNSLSILKYICYSFKNSMFFTFTLKFSIKINFQFKNFSRLNFCVLCVQVCNSLDNMCAMKQNSLFRKILVSILYIYIFLKKCRSEIEFSKKVHDAQRIYKRRIISGIDLIFITLIYTGLVFIGVGDWDGEISINLKASR